MTYRWLALFAAGCVLAVACATAGGDVKGGDLTPGGEGAIEEQLFDAGVSDLAFRVCIEDDGGVKPLWHNLYHDVFGPEVDGTGKKTGNARPGSCSFKDFCHGSSTGRGALSSTGIKCFDEVGCCLSMVGKRLLNPGNVERSPLLLYLRFAGDDPADIIKDGTMPKEPAKYGFPPARREQMREWIRSGRDASVDAATQDAALASDAGDASADGG